MDSLGRYRLPFRVTLHAKPPVVAMRSAAPPNTASAMSEIAVPSGIELAGRPEMTTRGLTSSTAKTTFIAFAAVPFSSTAEKETS